MSFRRNIGAMAVSSAGGQLALIATGVIAARGLGPVERGLYAVVTLVPTILSQFLLLGLPIAVTYFVASDGGMAAAGRRQIRHIAASQVLAGVVLFSLTLLLLRAQIPDALILPLMLMIPASAGLIVQEYAYATLQGLNRFNQVALARLFPITAYAVMAFVLWLMGRVSLNSLSAAWALAYCASAWVGVLLLSKGGMPTVVATEHRSAGSLFRFGGHAFVGTVAPMDSFRLDQVIGSFLLSPASLGIYVVAQAFSALPKIVATNAGVVIYADTARSTAADPSGLPALLRNIARLCVISGALCFVLVLLLPWLNRLFFGPAFVDAAVPSQILVAAAWLGSVRRFVTEFAKGLGRPEIQTISEIAICFTVGIAALPLTRDQGYIGLAMAMAIGQALVLVLSLALSFQHLKRSQPTGAAPNAGA